LVFKDPGDATLGFANADLHALQIFEIPCVGPVALGGTLGSLILPRVLFILYGVFAEQSIAKLCIAAVIPDFLSLSA